MWWLFHTSALFWKVVFPLHARNMSGKIKYIHVTSVILGILLPLVPIISTMVKFAVNPTNFVELSSSVHGKSELFLSGGLGFKPPKFPVILCTSSEPDVIFYSLLLPINLILAFGCTLLLIIFWTIHRVSVPLLK